MDFNQQLSAIEQSIAQGNLEPAMEQLVALLHQDQRYAELAQIARVNQADLYQLKAAVLKGTISPDDARMVTNQITDSALQIIRRGASGKFTLTDPAPVPERSQAWRYYVAGGVVALAGALLLWKLLGGKAASDTCPTFEATARYRVLVLPFKQTGAKKASQPEIDIADGLTILINKTPGLQNLAQAYVNQRYDIEKEYPDFLKAAEIGEGCEAQMVVWGKINQDEKNEYKLDIRYKLLGVSGTTTGDTTLGNLLKMKDQGGNLAQDVETVTRFLYLVLANQARVPVLPAFIAAATTADTTSSGTAGASADTSLLLSLAQNRVNNKQPDKAIALYTQVLQADPDNREAHTKRGTLLYEKGDYEAASRDLEAAAPNAKKADRNLLKIRVDASLKSGQPAKAKEDLKLLRETAPPTPSSADGTWLDKKGKETQDSMSVFEVRRDKFERMAQAKPQNTQLRAGAAKANLALGNVERALSGANEVIKKDPKNADAVDVAIEVHLHNGDTVSAKKILDKASAKSIEKWEGIVPPLTQPIRH